MPFVQGSHIHTIPKWTKGWSVSFYFKPVGSAPSGFGSILHNTIDSRTGCDPWCGYGQPGYRIPGIWTSPGQNQLHFASYVNGDHNYQVKGPDMLVDQWYSVLVKSEKMANGNYMYSVTVDGQVIHQVENTTPQAFENVRTYVSNPWQPIANGRIQNLRMTIEPEEHEAGK